MPHFRRCLCVYAKASFRASTSFSQSPRGNECRSRPKVASRACCNYFSLSKRLRLLGAGHGNKSPLRWLVEMVTLRAVASVRRWPEEPTSGAQGGVPCHSRREARFVRGRSGTDLRQRGGCPLCILFVFDTGSAPFGGTCLGSDIVISQHWFAASGPLVIWFLCDLWIGYMLSVPGPSNCLSWMLLKRQ